MIGLFLMFMPFLGSCASQINGSLLANGQADLHIQVSLEPRMAALLGRLAAVSSTEQADAPLLYGPAISASMASAPGILSVSLENKSPTAVEGPVSISQLGDFLASGLANGESGEGLTFISFEQGTQGGRCAVNLSLATGPQILGLISEDVNDYLSALMAPIATGEILTRVEYLALVGTVYGRGIADEISSAVIRASIDFPGTVQSVRGGTFSGRRAEFEVPLLDLLVLETPLNYEINW